MCVNPGKCHDSLVTEEEIFIFLLLEVIKGTVNRFSIPSLSLHVPNLSLQNIIENT